MMLGDFGLYSLGLPPLHLYRAVVIHGGREGDWKVSLDTGKGGCLLCGKLKLNSVSFLLLFLLLFFFNYHAQAILSNVSDKIPLPKGEGYFHSPPS